MKEIQLTNSSKIALVDDEDYSEVSRFRWQINESRKCVYRCEVDSQGQRTIYSHRQIMNAKDGEYIDHRFHNFLDNRKSQLRRSTNQQNCFNQRPRSFTGRTSRFKGVFWNSACKKWQAGIMFNYRKIYLGVFASEEAAAMRYNMEASRLFGEFAFFNEI